MQVYLAIKLVLFKSQMMRMEALPFAQYLLLTVLERIVLSYF